MRTLLLVYDEPTLRNIARSKLSGKYDVLEAASAAEALDVFRHHRSVDLLICEMKLRPISGMELALLLMASNFKLLTILITDLPHDQWTPHWEKELAELPGDQVTIIERPFTFSDLTAAITILLAEKTDLLRAWAKK